MAGGEAAGHDERTDLLDLTQTLSDARAPGAAPVREGTRFGDYVLRRSLGEGGMGAVYLAEQTAPVRRWVAIKLSHQRVSAADQARFAVERQALARMGHPAIAQVFDAGTLLDGTPYFVMEYVAGERITDHCERRGLGVAARVDLLRRACLGVGHAHQKGVLHCDLKPANILALELDGESRPKIIDFGIARAAGARSADPGSGTPGYMSPEQASGEAALDTRTDVFSLGALLYELVSGQPLRDPQALVGLDGAEQRRRIASMPIPALPRLAGLARRRRRELDAIVARACAREPEARYAGAAQLAEDLGRWLERQPVAAMPDRAGYRLRCFLARHAMLAAVAALSVLLLAALGWRLVAQLDETRRERDTAERVTTLLLETFRAADPYSYPEGSMTAREILRLASGRMARPGIDDAVRARLLETLGDVQSRLELYPDAEATLSEALATRGRIDGQAAATSPAAFLLARNLLHADRFDDAVAALERALRAARASGQRAAEAEALLLLAEAHQYGGDLEASSRLLSEAAPLVEADAGIELDERLARFRGRLAYEQGRYADAVALLREARRLAEQIHGSGSQLAADTLSDLALAEGRAGNLDEAEALLRQIAANTEANLGPESISLAVDLDNLGVLLQRRGTAASLAEAEALQRRALRIFLERDVAGSTRPAVVSNNLAATLDRLGRHEEAFAHFQRATTLMAAAVGEEHALYGVVLHNHGRARLGAGQLDEAERLLDQAGGILRGSLGTGHQRFQTWRLTRAQLALGRGQHEEAARLLAAIQASAEQPFAGNEAELARLAQVRQSLSASGAR